MLRCSRDNLLRTPRTCYITLILPHVRTVHRLKISVLKISKLMKYLLLCYSCFSISFFRLSWEKKLSRFCVRTYVLARTYYAIVVGIFLFHFQVCLFSFATFQQTDANVQTWQQKRKEQLLSPRLDLRRAFIHFCSHCLEEPFSYSTIILRYQSGE